MNQQTRDMLTAYKDVRGHTPAWIREDMTNFIHHYSLIGALLVSAVTWIVLHFDWVPANTMYTIGFVGVLVLEIVLPGIKRFSEYMWVKQAEYLEEQLELRVNQEVSRQLALLTPGPAN